MNLCSEVVLSNSAGDEPVSSCESKPRATYCSVTGELEVTCDVGALVGRGHGH